MLQFFFLQFTFKAITNNNNERMNKQTSERMKNRKIEKNKRWHTAFVCESFASRKKKTSTQSNAESAWCAAHKSPNMKLHLRLPLSLPQFCKCMRISNIISSFFSIHSFLFLFVWFAFAIAIAICIYLCRTLGNIIERILCVPYPIYFAAQ